jgi:hypothetical protein
MESRFTTVALPVKATVTYLEGRGLAVDLNGRAILAGDAAPDTVADDFDTVAATNRIVGAAGDFSGMLPEDRVHLDTEAVVARIVAVAADGASVDLHKDDVTLADAAGVAMVVSWIPRTVGMVKEEAGPAAAHGDPSAWTNMVTADLVPQSFAVAGGDAAAYKFGDALYWLDALTVTRIPTATTYRTLAGTVLRRNQHAVGEVFVAFPHHR